MPSPQVTPVSHSARPQAVGDAQGSTTPATCSPTSPAPLLRYDPASSSWRTFGGTLISDSQPYSGSWPESGMTRDGYLYPLRRLAPPMAAPAYSSWRLLPTPTASRSDTRNVDGWHETHRRNRDRGVPPPTYSLGMAVRHMVTKAAMAARTDGDRSPTLFDIGNA